MNELEKCKQAALTLEWGGDQQIEDENRYFEIVSGIIPPACWNKITTYGLKATTEEIISYAETFLNDCNACGGEGAYFENDLDVNDDFEKGLKCEDCKGFGKTPTEMTVAELFSEYGFEHESTGGNCTAFIKRLDGYPAREFLVTIVDDAAVPENMTDLCNLSYFWQSEFDDGPNDYIFIAESMSVQGVLDATLKYESHLQDLATVNYNRAIADINKRNAENGR